jgi:hypothetical protein
MRGGDNMNMPGFTADLAVHEFRAGYVVTRETTASEAGAVVEPQQLGGGSFPFAFYELDCGQSDQFGGPCFAPGQPKTCRLSVCSLRGLGGYVCQFLGNVTYPGCIRDCYQPPG